MKYFFPQDFDQLAPVMKQADNVSTARHISFEDYLKLFDEEVHGKIRGSAIQPGITHVVCLENLDVWSSHFGARVSLAVGSKPEGAEIPSFTLEKVLTTPFFRLGDLPSRFQYPVAYADVSELRASLPEPTPPLAAPPTPTPAV